MRCDRLPSSPDALSYEVNFLILIVHNEFENLQDLWVVQLGQEADLPLHKSARVRSASSQRSLNRARCHSTYRDFFLVPIVIYCKR